MVDEAENNVFFLPFRNDKKKCICLINAFNSTEKLVVYNKLPLI